MSETGLSTNQNQQVSIQQLYKQPELQLEQDKLITFLNQEPPTEWVKVHPYIKDHKYLPIEKVEFMLKKFFKKYSIKVVEYKQILNSISVCVTVKYLDPISNEMTEHDGVGACELQTAKDTGPLKLDASNINKGAVPMALGIAKSIAVKDACDHIGNIFGANLNRKDIMEFMPDTNLAGVVNQKEHKRMLALIDKAKTRAELDDLRSHLTEVLTPIFEEKWTAVK
jgi:hypothetical protein